MAAKKLTTGEIFERLHRVQERLRKAKESPQEAVSCGRCAFMEMQRTGPVELSHVMVCKRFPPHITISPVQQRSGQMGVANLTGFPHVNAGMWCYEFEPVAVDGEGTLAV
ncbi:MAG: hypothetical protein ACRD33_00035 [Candidatus Acidiferrales bacterium]